VRRGKQKKKGKKRQWITTETHVISPTYARCVWKSTMYTAISSSFFLWTAWCPIAQNAQGCRAFEKRSGCSKSLYQLFPRPGIPKRSHRKMTNPSRSPNLFFSDAVQCPTPVLPVPNCAVSPALHASAVSSQKKSCQIVRVAPFMRFRPARSHKNNKKVPRKSLVSSMNKETRENW
jgi:hypothetical protein